MKNLFTDYETVDKMFIQDFICVSGVIKVLMWDAFVERKYAKKKMLNIFTKVSKL